ncbi:hypothetical protein [Variovorax soli]|uniref:Uncharacterized protein n=1 Tax=Variovorax soli TaxID=376815 RepID=A0ABU1NET0_9BURK|nr:hypothetical protein [Variovorax soli]MDR6536979.1 hypothetical protein [Variovorax soli]
MLTSEAKYILRQAVEERFPERQGSRDASAAELLSSLLRSRPELIKELDFDWKSRDATARQLAGDSWLWDTVEGVLERAQSALSHFGDDAKQMSRWALPLLQKLDGSKSIEEGAAMDQLSDCADVYVRSDWAESPTLELWLVRQMIFAETYAFGRQLGIPLQGRSAKFWWMWTKSTAKWVIGLAVAFAIGDAHGWAAGVMAYVAWLALIRYLASDQLKALVEPSETFALMRNAYVISLRSSPCPAEIERALSLAENKGAVWPAGLRALLERALARNKVIWM